jgi:hypothetical protein
MRLLKAIIRIFSMKLTFREYLRYAEKAILSSDKKESNYCYIIGTILAWSAIESFVNNMLDDFASLPEDLFEFHERAFLLENKLKFEDHGENIGKFILEGKEYRKLDEKIFFLIAKYGGRNSSIKGESLWQKFEYFKDIRNKLVHPRRNVEINIDAQEVEGFIETSKSIIRLISKKVWKKEVIF